MCASFSKKLSDFLLFAVSLWFLRNVGHLIMQGSLECSFERQSQPCSFFGKDALRTLVLGEEKKEPLDESTGRLLWEPCAGSQQVWKGPHGLPGDQPVTADALLFSFFMYKLKVANQSQGPFVMVAVPEVP